MKKRIIFTLCMLCMSATLLFVSGLTHANADAVVLSDEATANAILKDDDGKAPTALSLEWTYGDADIISYAFRPQHGDTAYYTVYTKVEVGDDNIEDESDTADGVDVTVGEEYEKFAVKYIDDNAIFYEVKDNEIDTDTSFKVQSLNAYLRTLKTGNYSLNVKAPSGTAATPHSHWYDNNADCNVTAYSKAELDISLKVNAYELAADKVGNNESSKPVKYRVQNAEVLYSGEDNNVPQIELTLDTSDGKLVLVEGSDYTLSSDAVNVGYADLKIAGIGGFSGEVTINNAYKIVQAENSVSDVYVVRWKYGEYDKNVNLFTAAVKWGAEDLYFAVATDAAGKNLVDGLDEIRLTDGVVSPQVEQLLNTLDAKKTYYLYAIVEGGDNYYDAKDYTQFEVVEITNTWTTTPSIVGWEWHGFDENVNVINAVPAFGDGVKFSVYTKDGDEYTALKFDGKESFELEKDDTGSYKASDTVVKVLSNLDAGTYYLFASFISDTENYSSINASFSASALVPFRVSQARNYWTQIPKLSNWAFGEYDPEINVISAAAAHCTSDIKCRVYKQNGDKIDLVSLKGTTSFTVSAQGAIPKVVSEGFKVLGVGKYYLRAEVAATKNYTGLQEVVADFAQLPSFEVKKAENYWNIAPSINAWSKGNYTNEDNIPVAAAHLGTARIVIVNVDDEENVIYDSENNINKLSEAAVGTYLLTATVAGTDNYSGLTFDTIFHIFVPKTENVGIAWWLVLIIVICSLGVLVFILWLLHDKGILQMLTSKVLVAMRTKATMDATIAAVRANKVAEEAKERIRRAEELERLEAESTETEKDDSAVKDKKSSPNATKKVKTTPNESNAPVKSDKKHKGAK